MSLEAAAKIVNAEAEAFWKDLIAERPDLLDRPTPTRHARGPVTYCLAGSDTEWRTDLTSDPGFPTCSLFVDGEYAGWVQPHPETRTWICNWKLTHGFIDAWNDPHVDSTRAHFHGSLETAMAHVECSAFRDDGGTVG